MLISGTCTGRSVHLTRGWGRKAALVGALSIALLGPAVMRAAEPGQEEQKDMAGGSAGGTLHVVATAHLDTQWLWTIQDTIEKHIPATLHQNFALFEKFPHYVFSFEGAFRYMLMREYYPADFARMKEYVKQGRWQVCGSFVDACDVNVPSPESLVRQILYGNGYFEREFGRTSCDVFLPDCFGFGAALPAVAAHCGLKGFSTQKLTWGSSVGIPFDIGVWEGVGGATLLAALNPGSYSSGIENDLSADPVWQERIAKLGVQAGAPVAYKYFGVGDVGGAPDAGSVEWLEKAIAASGPIRVRSVAADALYRELTPEQIARLPRYAGELLMTKHGVGCYTSQTAMKRWNRRNEQLADAAERAAVAADWLGGRPYPRARLTEAWIRFLWHQFHDDLTGTSIPAAYNFSWNDEVVALNQFAAVLTDSVGAVAGMLDTQAEGIPLVVYNAVAESREDIVEAEVEFPEGVPPAVRVFDPEGREVPAQIGWRGERRCGVVFLASMSGAGFAVYDVRPAGQAAAAPTDLQVSTEALENGRYRVRLDAQGDVAGITDLRANRELLSGPIRLQLLRNVSPNWPEWEIEYGDIIAQPMACVGGPARVRVLESGPARVAVEVYREHSGSLFTQQIRLAAGAAGDRVEVETRVDWRTPATLLKAAFPLAVDNAQATYDLGVGVAERGNNTPQLYEVPAQQWADLTAADGSYGVGLSSDCKYGWDKPDDHTLRLSLIHTPQRVDKDMGWHRFTYALAGHRGNWQNGAVPGKAARLNQPLLAFCTPAHPGPLGRNLDLARTSSPQVAVQAIKRAENSDEIIVRVRETWGRALAGAKVSLAAGIDVAREVDGSEKEIGPAGISEGRLVTDLRPWQLRSFAVRLDPAAERSTPPTGQAVDLPFDRCVASADGEACAEGFDADGHCIPAELWPAELDSGGIAFKLGPAGQGRKNALTCRGQTLTLPPGEWTRVYLLAAGAEGDTRGTFSVSGRTTELDVAGFTGFMGQSNSLIVEGRVVEPWAMAPAFIKRDRLAWVGTHRHDAAGKNEPYLFCYLFQYALDLPAGTSTLVLPDNPSIRILAATVVRGGPADTPPAQALYDDLAPVQAQPGGGTFIEPVSVELRADDPRAVVLYTLDGSEPTAAAARYTEPLRIEQDTILATRTLRDGRLGDYVVRRRYTFAVPRAAVDPGPVQAGLNYAYYHGQWRELPDFSALEPVAQGVAPHCDIALRRRNEHFGIQFSGYMRIPADGVYTFFTASDDGSRLYIGDVLVVDNDGHHGMVERQGTVGLIAGLHPLRVDYFQGGGDLGLEVSYQGPGFERRTLPADALYHVGE